MPYEGNRTGGDVPLAELGSAGKTPAGKGRHHALDRHSDHIDSAFARSLPTWPYSSGWGYYPSGGLGLLLVIVILVLLLR